MKIQVALVGILFLSFCDPSRRPQEISILKIEVHLSAFGVEADDFPSIDGYIDFTNDSSKLTKSYYNPDFKKSTYYLSKDEIKKAFLLLKNSDLSKLKKEYGTNRSDQPTSTFLIHTNKWNYLIEDYGLGGDHPLPDLYKIIYKL